VANWPSSRGPIVNYRLIAARVSKTKIYEDCCICGVPSAHFYASIISGTLSMDTPDYGPVKS